MGPLLIQMTGQLVYNGTDAIFTPLDAYTIDTKIDDAQPLTGLVTARGPNSYNVAGDTGGSCLLSIDTPGAPGSSACVTNGAGNPYNLTNNSPACVIRLPFN